MNTLFRNGLTVGGVLAGMSLTTLAALDPQGDCRDTYREDASECNFTFNNPGSPTYQNQLAFETCLQGADAALTACLDGRPDNPHREEFIQDLEQCVRDWPDGGAGFESCLRAMLRVYRARLGLPPDDPCGLTPVGTGRVAPIESLRSAALALGHQDGVYPVRVQTTLSFQAGVSATNSYNLAGRPCIRQAELIAIYETKDGMHSVLLDADTDTADGVFFNLPVFANRVVDTNRMLVLALYFDADNNPVFMEYARLSIDDSPIQGDWNRDGVVNAQDMIDYLSAFSSEMPRADMNQDGVHDVADLIEFLSGIDD